MSTTAQRTKSGAPCDSLAADTQAVAVESRASAGLDAPEPIGGAGGCLVTPAPSLTQQQIAALVDAADKATGTHARLKAELKEAEKDRTAKFKEINKPIDELRAKLDAAACDAADRKYEAYMATHPGSGLTPPDGYEVRRKGRATA